VTPLSSLTISPLPHLFVERKLFEYAVFRNYGMTFEQEFDINEGYCFSGKFTGTFAKKPYHSITQIPVRLSNVQNTTKWANNNYPKE